MKTILFPYGKERLACDFSETELTAVLTSQLENYVAPAGEEALVEAAMENPIDSAPLWQLAQGKNKVVIIASDHTRPVPSKIIMPRMLTQIRKGNPEADITILIATGCHRGTTTQELEDKFGPEIFLVRGSGNRSQCFQKRALFSELGLAPFIKCFF